MEEKSFNFLTVSKESEIWKLNVSLFWNLKRIEFLLTFALSTNQFFLKNQVFLKLANFQVWNTVTSSNFHAKTLPRILLKCMTKPCILWGFVKYGHLLIILKVPSTVYF